MSEKGKAPPPKTRRKVSVEGEAPLEEAKKRNEPRSLEEILGDPKNAEIAENEVQLAQMWSPGRLEQFLRGQITLGDLEGITKQEQYEMAKIGFSYLTSGKLENAKTVFEGLLALDPFDAYFHTALGSIAQQENQLEEADKRYTRALEINPFSPVAFANRGEVRISLGRLADGARDLVRALEEDPNATMPSTIRARATIQVVREQLAALDLNELTEVADRQKTGPKVPVLGASSTGSKIPAAQPRASQPAGQSPSRAAPRAARPGPRPGPAPRKK